MGRMGDIQGGGYNDEKPVHEVVISKTFALGRYEVTFAEYDRFCQATGREKPTDQGWGRGKRPVINVSWNDAKAYAKWLSEQTDKKYRLPTESEWEYGARSGSETKYWWGDQANHDCANYGKDKCCDVLAKSKDRWEYTSPVGSFKANRLGLHDTAGNVFEWVDDCGHAGYTPKDGCAWTTGGKCGLRVKSIQAWLAGMGPIKFYDGFHWRSTHPTSVFCILRGLCMKQFLQL